MAAEKKVNKRSRHWEDVETKQLIYKWSDENIQQRLKACTRKKKIWDEIALYLQAAGYERDGEMCKTRIHTLTSAYRNYLDVKRNKTGSAPPRKPPCFDQLDDILGDKPTTYPHHLKSSSTTTTCSEFDEQKNTNNFQYLFDDSVANTDIASESLLNNSEIPIDCVSVESGSISDNSNNSSLNSAPSNSGFYFKKTKKRSSSEILFDKLNQSMSAFMKAQSDQDREFLSSFLKKSKSEVHVGDEGDEKVVKVRSENDLFFIEIELKQDMTLEEFSAMVKEEYNLKKETVLMIKKLPNILIRNEKDFERLKNGQEIEFSCLHLTEEDNA